MNAPDWKARAAALKFDGRSVINGRRVAAADSSLFDCISPIDGRVLTQVARGKAADIDAAVKAARQAFADRRWAGQSPAARKKVLQAFSAKILEHAEELALLETLDMGKPIKNSFSVDVNSSARCINWYGEAIDKVYDEIAPTGDDALALIQREAMGVIGVVVPWNYPMIMAAWKLGPALATGNSIVLKPSEKSPLTALRLAEIAIEAGLPEGVFNVVPGYGHEAGEALALHMDVDAIGFTGSTRVGRFMLEYAGKSNLKRVYNELGGKSAYLVFNDSDALQRAAETVVDCMNFNMGQSCNAPSRLLVQDDIADQIIEMVVEHTKTYVAANPLEANCNMGALVDEQQVRSVLGYIDAGNAEGAGCAVGGKRVLDETGGCYVAPTVFTKASADMKIAREEIFGPVLSVIRFKTEAEAIAIANDSPYGLQASVWSSNINRAHRVAKQLRAGTIHVNQYDDDDITVPFGGYKQSGNGRDKSLHAMEKYTELKTTWLRIDPNPAAA